MNDSVVKINPHKTLAQKAAEDAIRNTENKISYYTMRKETFDPILTEMEAAHDTLTVTLCTNSVDVSFAGKRKVLNTYFGILRKHGFEPDTRPTDKNKSGYCSYFHNAAGATLWLNFTSTQCKRVQVGTKTVEQPIYETVCDDD